jgi:glycosyltransferase involved in cell wall biosynthesis
MRVIHVISSLAPSLGGTSKACVEMARAVAARGHTVEIYTTDFGLEGQVPADGASRADGAATVRYFPVQRPRGFKPSWALYRALKRDLPHADVVHLHSLYLFHDWATGRICHRAGIPYIVQPHGTLDPYIWRRHRARKYLMEWVFQNRVLRQAAVLQYTTEEEMCLAAPYAQGVSGTVVPLGIDLDEYGSLPSRERFLARHPETRGKRIVLFLSRLHEKKGLDILAAAFGRIADKFPDAHLVLAGPEDGIAKRLERWLHEAGIADRTSFTGMIGGEDKRAALAAASVFALPSYSENFGIAVLEAMAAGLPVAISDQVNLWREVAESGSGIVTPCDRDAFAGALERLLGDDAAACRMGEAGRTLAREKFAWPRVVVALEKLYADVAARRSIR